MKDLEKLAALLRRKPLTAREVSIALGCCLPTAYQRIRALAKLGGVYRTKPRTKQPGPKATAYGVR